MIQMPTFYLVVSIFDLLVSVQMDIDHFRGEKINLTVEPARLSKWRHMESCDPIWTTRLFTLYQNRTAMYHRSFKLKVGQLPLKTTGDGSSQSAKKLLKLDEMFI